MYACFCSCDSYLILLWGQDISILIWQKQTTFTFGGQVVGLYSQSVYSNVIAIKPLHSALTGAAGLLCSIVGWLSSCSSLCLALVSLWTFFGNLAGNSLAGFLVAFGESTCWYGVQSYHEMKTMTLKKNSFISRFFKNLSWLTMGLRKKQKPKRTMAIMEKKSNT